MAGSRRGLTRSAAVERVEADEGDNYDNCSGYVVEDEEEKEIWLFGCGFSMEKRALQRFKSRQRGLQR